MCAGTKGILWYYTSLHSTSNLGLCHLTTWPIGFNKANYSLVGQIVCVYEYTTTGKGDVGAPGRKGKAPVQQSLKVWLRHGPYDEDLPLCIVMH